MASWLTIGSGLGLGAAALWAISRPSGCIYLDCNATTPVARPVIKAMESATRVAWGNAHSKHGPGLKANEVFEEARSHVAELFDCNPDEVVFTSGATEALNLAIHGVIGQWEENNPGRPPHVIASAVEHPAVLQPLKHLQQEGRVTVTYLRPDSDGIVSAKSVMDALRPNTALVAIMWANNEVGAINPIRTMAKGLKRHPARFLVDATQSVAFVPPMLSTTPIDLMAVSAHKFYGPKGIGALYVREGVKLAPVLFGGGQQGGVRPGTLPVPLIAGLGAASKLAVDKRPERVRWLMTLQEVFWEIMAPVTVRLNGPPLGCNRRLPNNLSLVLPVSAEAVIRLTPGVAISSGSACSCGKPSHVLQAMGLSKNEAKRTIRIGLGMHLSRRDVRRAAKMIRDTTERLVRRAAQRGGPEGNPSPRIHSSSHGAKKA